MDKGTKDEQNKILMTTKIQNFVFHFGEMGSRWGFNRTVGQIYALLVIVEDPVSANEIASALGISRGNVSMGLKELNGWQLVQTIHKPGDRKDYYHTKGTIWDMANKVFEERRKREMDPTLSLLRDLMLEAPANEQEKFAQERISEIHDLLENIIVWTQSLQTLSPEKIKTLMKLGSSVGKVIELKGKFVS